MKVQALLTFVCVAAMLPCASQEFVIPPKKQLPVGRIHFVVDVSGSMRPDLAQVVKAINALVKPGDEFSMKVTVFSDSSAPWDRGWVHGVGPDDIKAAQKLIEEYEHEGTLVGPPLASAGEEKVIDPKTGKETDCLIVLVTDGRFIYEMDELVIALAAKSKHPILAFGVGQRNEDVLGRIGELGGGYVK